MLVLAWLVKPAPPPPPEWFLRTSSDGLRISTISQPRYEDSLGKYYAKPFLVLYAYGKEVASPLFPEILQYCTGILHGSAFVSYGSSFPKLRCDFLN